MNQEQPILISLTGENSHSITIEAGQGAFSIGTIGMNPKKNDVLVDGKLPINWNSFNSFYTPYGKSNAHLYPFGNWPRLFRYWGADTNFIEWSEKREIEDFHWFLTQSLSANFTNSNIPRLIINLENHKLDLKLGNHRFLSIGGNLDNLTITKIGEIGSLSFYPTTTTENSRAYQLPVFEAFEEMTTLAIHVNPLGQPFDCKSIVQFKNLRILNLSGNLTNLECLEEFESLEILHLRYAPNLESLPPMKNLKTLTSFLGWNMEETKGNLLKKELKELAKERKLDYSISQLRKSIWFTTEYGIPFSAWQGKNAKVAIRTYKAALKNLKKSKTEEEVKEILIKFTQTFNDLPQIETTEREDIAEAIYQLRQVPSIEIDAEKANEWFDKNRDY